MQYRPEIDGLRAIAVVPMILFHAGFEMFSGGFVGVDVFFVISGYLITSIILADLDAGSFSLLTFYEKRIRRLIPALYFMLLVCLPFACLWLLPADLDSFLESMASATLYASNFYFWRSADYFSPDAELLPLLHTWTLAVEEQYYLLFPIAVLSVCRLGKHAITLLVIAGFAISFLLSVALSDFSPVANYYLLTSRAWELLLGGMVAILMSKRDLSQQGNAVTNVLSSVGLAMIATAVFLYDGRTPFPGIPALLPTIGAALVILFASQANWPGKLLGHRSLVGIGLISYSAYLWHQPIFAFARHRLIAPTDGIQLITLLLMVGVASYLSWRYIEKPFRNRERFSSRFIFAGTAATTLLLLAIIGLLYSGVLWSDRSLATELTQVTAPNYGVSEDCSAFTETCRTGKTPPVALLWGDSFAMHLAPALQSSHSRLPFQQYTLSSCAPLIGYAVHSSALTTAWGAQCIRHNDAAIEWLQAHPGVKYVVISATFNFPGFSVLTRDGVVDYSFERSLEALANTVRVIQSMNRQVVIVSPPPQNGKDLGRCYIKTRLFDGNPEDCSFSNEIYSTPTQNAYRLLESIEASAPVLWLDELICRNGNCEITIGDSSLYRDNGHLSITGARALGEQHDLFDLITSLVSAKHERD